MNLTIGEKGQDSSMTELTKGEQALIDAGFEKRDEFEHNTKRAETWEKKTLVYPIDLYYNDVYGYYVLSSKNTLNVNELQAITLRLQELQEKNDV